MPHSLLSLSKESLFHNIDHVDNIPCGSTEAVSLADIIVIVYSLGATGSAFLAKAKFFNDGH